MKVYFAIVKNKRTVISKMDISTKGELEAYFIESTEYINIKDSLYLVMGNQKITRPSLWQLGADKQPKKLYCGNIAFVRITERGMRDIKKKDIEYIDDNFIPYEYSF